MIEWVGRHVGEGRVDVDDLLHADDVDVDGGRVVQVQPRVDAVEHVRRRRHAHVPR